MKRQRKQPRRPRLDLQIRPATLDDCDALGVVSVAAARKPVFDTTEEVDLAWTPTMSASNWRDYLSAELPSGEFVVVAQIGQRVIGYVIAGGVTGRADYVRYVSALYVLPTLQRRGVGRALLQYVANRLIGEGVNSLLIGCLKENTSCTFYQHIGGVEVDQQLNSIEHDAMDEIFFGWSNLTTLTSGDIDDKHTTNYNRTTLSLVRLL